MPPAFDKDLLLIICASGKQAAELVPHVYGKWKRLRLQVNSESSKERLEKTFPDAEVVIANLSDPASCDRIMKDVTVCYHINPPMQLREAAIGINVVYAAAAQKAAGGPMTHFVFSSVIFPILTKMIHHDAKRLVEEQLVETGLNYTILQPTHMCETFPLAKMLEAGDNPVFPINWNPNTKFSFVSTKDLGEAAANVLNEREKHYWATYQIVGTPTPLDYNEVVDIVSEAIGKKIEIKKRPYDEAVNEGLKAILGGKEPPLAGKEIGGRMFLYYNDRGLVGNSNTLEMLLGHKTMDYKTWVDVKLKEIKGQQK